MAIDSKIRNGVKIGDWELDPTDPLSPMYESFRRIKDMLVGTLFYIFHDYSISKITVEWILQSIP